MNKGHQFSRLVQFQVMFDFDLESKPNKEEILEGLNNLIKQNYEVSISSISETELDEKPDLVRTMAVQPPRGKGEIRMIDIGKGVDYQPCGGTHVNNTSEIREVKKIKVENKGRHWYANQRLTIKLCCISTNQRAD